MNKHFSIPAVLLLIGIFGGCVNQRDLERANSAASHIHSQMGSGDYAGIYRESASGFKTLSEPEFVTLMTNLQKELGALKNRQQRAYTTGVDSNAGKTYSLIFDVEYELGRVRETLVFARGDDGAMQMWRLGINPIK